MTINDTYDALLPLFNHELTEKLAFCLLWLLIAWLAIRSIQWLNQFLQNRVRKQQGITVRGFKIKDYTIWSEARLTQLILSALQFVAKTAIILVCVIWLLNTVSLFTPLEKFISTSLDTVDSNFKAALWATLQYLPRLVFIVFIGAITWMILRAVRFLFGEVEKGSIRFDNFYREWARPTSRIVQAIFILFAVALIAPNLPGSQSDAFKGISIFVGVLVSLGSTSAVRNAIAGIVLTYMRAYQTKDFVQIANTLGTVVEKGVLVTRVLTPRLEEVSIPNSEVLNSHVINYSAQARNQGVIFHTPVTVVYDIPYQTVETLLLKAAEKTSHIARAPKPFVLHSKLHDFYVEYELHVYVTTPEQWIYIYSDLRRNIQATAVEMNIDLNTPTHLHMRGPFPEVTLNTPKAEV